MPSGDSEKVDRRRRPGETLGGAVVEDTLNLKTATVVREGCREEGRKQTKRQKS